jgi:hypothetical protein
VKYFGDTEMARMGGARWPNAARHNVPTPPQPPPLPPPLPPPGPEPPVSSFGDAVRRMRQFARANPMEARLAFVGLFFGSLAIANFMQTRWEVNQRLKQLPPEQERAWREGTYRPPKKGVA